MSKMRQKPRIGITIGDINGIGPEVIIKTLSDNRILNHLTPVIYGSTKTLSYYRKLLNNEEFNYSQVKDGEHLNHKKVNVVNCWDEEIEIDPGTPTSESGTASRLSIQKCTEHLKNDFVDAVVTAPINKKNIQSDDFQFPGHTEYYTKEFEAKSSLMLLVSENLRVGVVTGHVALKEVSSKLTKELIANKLNIMLKALKKDFGISKPKIAVMGLNPHAGEEGLIGDEEINIIQPAISDIKNKGNIVQGPFPADGFFGTGQHTKYDGILAMYHDQGLIPFKTIAFENGVNYTAGLSIVRTSPDHGTAYNLAGKGAANESSFREALFLARDIVNTRSEEQELVEGSLKAK